MSSIVYDQNVDFYIDFVDRGLRSNDSTEPLLGIHAMGLEHSRTEGE